MKNTDTHDSITRRKWREYDVVTEPEDEISQINQRRGDVEMLRLGGIRSRVDVEQVRDIMTQGEEASVAAGRDESRDAKMRSFRKYERIYGLEESNKELKVIIFIIKRIFDEISHGSESSGIFSFNLRLRR